MAVVVLAIPSLLTATRSAGVPDTKLELIHLRASQINGCSSYVDLGAKSTRTAEGMDERLVALAAWRATPSSTAAERATPALAEAATRLADRPEPAPDTLWDEIAVHVDERQRPRSC